MQTQKTTVCKQTHIHTHIVSRMQTLQAGQILTEREREEHIFGTEPRSEGDTQTASEEESRSNAMRVCVRHRGVCDRNMYLM